MDREIIFEKVYSKPVSLHLSLNEIRVTLSALWWQNIQDYICLISIWARFLITFS